MIICSWNINGIKSLLEHDISILKNYNIDVLLLQEVRTSNLALIYQLASIFEFPYVFYNLSKKSGYAGVATLSKLTSTSQYYPDQIIPEEGRILVIDVLDNISIVNLYSPYIGVQQANKYKRVQWERDVRLFLATIKKNGRRLIVGGDLNIARTQLDVYKIAKQHPGFSELESSMFDELITTVNLRDAYREKSNEPGYTWGIRESKMRIDYFLIDTYNDMIINDCYPIYEAHKKTNPSDHYPLLLNINV